MSLRSDFGSVSERVVPSNARYHGVQSKLDTGASASKRPPAMPVNLQAQRRDEEFKRIRPATLARMIQDEQEEGLESVFNLGADDRNDTASQSSVRASKAAPAKSKAAGSVISVAGSVLSVIDSDTCVGEQRNLVLLDLREPEEFEKCRVPFAVSYPAPKINRDQFIPELQRCKRDPSKLLVIYHSNDTTTATLASLLIKKGWESVHALSGGFQEMVCSYSELLEGEVPERTMVSSAGSQRSTSSRPGSGSRSQSGGPRMPGEIRRGNSIPGRRSSAGSSGRSASPRSVSGRSVASGVRSMGSMR